MRGTANTLARGEHRRQLARTNPHRVYWGTHGCKKHRNHTGVCVCTCGDLLTMDTGYVFGEDLATAKRANA